MTLPTDNGVVSSPISNLTDLPMNDASNGKANTVVGKLVKSWRVLMQTECNINLFTKMLRLRISTRDIHSFLLKQSRLRKVYKDLDKPLSRSAMRSKLNDSCAFLMRQRRVVNGLKRDLLKSVGNKRFKQKKIIKQVRNKISLEKVEREKSDAIKISRYQILQAKMNEEASESKFQLPASL